MIKPLDTVFLAVTELSHSELLTNAVIQNVTLPEPQPKAAPKV